MKTKKKPHTHIWKYGSNIRVCESPFEFLIKGCGKVEHFINGVWK